MGKLIQVHKNLEVKKADVIVKARYKLNPLSLKFITTLISGLTKNDQPNQLYIFKVKDFQELTKLKRKDLYGAIKETLKELLEKPLYIPKGNDNSFLMLNWVASAEYKEGEGLIEFEISNKLRPYLLEAQKKFLKYKLENILPLKSSYVIRIYEILKDWYETYNRYGNKAEKNISIDELKEMLEIPRSYQYGNSSGIKKRILEKSQIELKKDTDITFDFEEIKTGRKITHLKITIKENIKNTKTIQTKKPYLKSLKVFVNYLRKQYAGNQKTFFVGNDTKTNKLTFFGIDTNKLLYGFVKDGEENTKYNNIESQEKYEKIFEVIKKSEIFQDLIENKFDIFEIFKNDKELFNIIQKEVKEILT